ncbi:MAG: zinc-binding dehydrogenase [Saprospiraceae bacterium]|nr:zinc-binding dehydrogenase [Saprospiraceae bacterium]
MKALVLKSPESELSYEDFELPKPGNGEVRIQVKAAALNHRDVWITKGQYSKIQYPTILGSDVAGLLDDREVILNPGIGWGTETSFPHKDFHILGMPSYGGFAEEVIIHSDQVFDKPQHLSFEQAAALPLAGVTAYRAMFTKGKIQAEDKVLITGIGGGVALMAFQFALAMGATVFVTSGSPEKLAQATEMGAAGAVNYRDPDWSKQLKEMAGGFNLIIDSAGGSGFSQLLYLTRPGAKVVTYGGSKGVVPDISPQLIFWRQLSILGTSMGSPREFANMLSFVRERKIVPIVDSTFDLADGQRAFARMEEGLQFGKLVLAGVD